MIGKSFRNFRSVSDSFGNNNHLCKKLPVISKSTSLPNHFDSTTDASHDCLPFGREFETYQLLKSITGPDWAERLTIQCRPASVRSLSQYPRPGRPCPPGSLEGPVELTQQNEMVVGKEDLLKEGQVVSGQSTKQHLRLQRIREPNDARPTDKLARAQQPGLISFS